MRFRRTSCKLSFLCITAMAPSAVRAQAPPFEAHRTWIELGLGGSRQDAYCASCVQHTIGGPTASLSFGATITQRFGLALLLRKFVEFNWDQSHGADYGVALAQYSPTAGITLNEGLGYGAQHGDHTPYGDNGSGTVIAGGIAFRLPEQSTVALTVNVDWAKSVSGTVKTPSGPGSSYHPLLFTVGLGLNLAASPH